MILWRPHCDLRVVKTTANLKAIMEVYGKHLPVWVQPHHLAKRMNLHIKYDKCQNLTDCHGHILTSKEGQDQTSPFSSNGSSLGEIYLFGLFL